MIQFNQLRILSDGSRLILDASVQDDLYYKNVYIDSVLIDNQDTYSSTGVSGSPLYKKIITGDTKHIRLELTSKDFTNGTLNLSSNLLFVYIKTKGTPSPNTPCGLDNITTIGVVYNAYPIYRECMDYMKELEVDCRIPKHLIDKILRFKALELSILSGDYAQAIQYWKKFYVDNRVSNTEICKKCYDTTI